MNDKIKFSKLDDAIGEIVISQPLKRNALNAAMWAALPKVLGQIATLTELKVLIVRGDGDHFASGADISEFETLYKTKESAARISADINAAFQSLAEFPLPTIAMIRGACVGGGCGLALCCDIRFSDPTGSFGITPAKLGLVYPYADIQRLIEIVGISNAKDLLFSARIIDAEQADKIGLVNTVYPAKDLYGETMAYAENIASLSRRSSTVMKTMIAAYQSGQRDNSDTLHQDFIDGFTGEDFQEGYKAFLEKRKPRFP